MILSWRNGITLFAIGDQSIGSFAICVSVRGVHKLVNNLVCVETKYLGVLLSLVVTGVVSRIFKWFNYFSVVGYNYNVRASKGRTLLSFYVGLVYRVVIKIPVDVKVFVGKRRLF